MNPIPPTSRACGFRMTWFDAMILLLGVVLSWWLQSLPFPLWWIVPAAFGHFFLFCNVFLIWRRLEVFWAGVFVLNVAVHVTLNELDPWSPLIWQTPVTVAVIAWQMRSPWYHGVFAHHINHKLADNLSHKLQP